MLFLCDGRAAAQVSRHAQIIEIARRWSGEIEEAGTGRQDVVRHYDTFRTSSLVSKMTIRIRDEGEWRGVDGASLPSAILKKRAEKFDS